MKAYILILALLVFWTTNIFAWAAKGPGFNCYKTYENWDINSTHSKIVEFGMDMLKTIPTLPGPDNRAQTLNLMRSRIIAYANWPDIYENDVCSFIGHFYNPKEKVGYLGSKSDHALHRMNQHLNAFWPRLQQLVKRSAHDLAKASTFVRPPRPHGYEWSENDYDHAGDWLRLQAEIEEIAMHIGAALHYMGDMAMPYHAKNITILDPQHTKYEDRVRDTWQDQFLIRHYEGTLPTVTGDFFGDMDRMATDGSDLAFESYGALLVDEGNTTRLILYKNQRMVAEFFYILLHYL